MRNLTGSRTWMVVFITMILGLAWFSVNRAAEPTPDASPPALPAEWSAEVAALKAEIARLKGIVPDQSHAMKDVAYHFANLWFAAQKQNWPLEEVHTTIRTQNSVQFPDAYRQMLVSCYACHVAAGKPFLRLQIPHQPEVPIIKFDPEP
jgi:hypothetical protein